jgi:uncharacterized protein (DUF433 family)
MNQLQTPAQHKELDDLVESDDRVLGGIPCFKGTRVPVALILKHLSLGWSLADIHKAYPTVNTEQIAKLLQRYSQEFSQGHGTKA